MPLDWNNYNIFDLTPLNRHSYLVKVEECSQRELKSYTGYVDSNIELIAYNLFGKKNIIGYVIDIKDKIKYNMLPLQWSIQIINKEVKKHNMPKLIYHTQKVHLYKFNEENLYSYWFACRLPITSGETSSKLSSKND